MMGPSEERALWRTTLRQEKSTIFGVRWRSAGGAAAAVASAWLSVAACQPGRKDVSAPPAPGDSRADRAARGPEAGRGDGGTNDASRDDPPSRELTVTVAEARASLVRRQAPLRLDHGGQRAGPCVDWTRRVQRVEYGEDLASEEAGAADAARAALNPAERSSGAGFDLDGDGQDDVSVVDGAVDVTRSSEVYVVRGDCGYSAGVFASSEPLEPLPHRSRGLSDLATTETLPEGSGTTYRVTYRFDGHAYHPVARRRVRGRDPRVDERGPP